MRGARRAMAVDACMAAQSTRAIASHKDTVSNGCVDRASGLSKPRLAAALRHMGFATRRICLVAAADVALVATSLHNLSKQDRRAK